MELDRQKSSVQGGGQPPEEEKTPVWLTILTGFLVGIGCIAPGISGGAIAVVFGLYSKITDAIAHFYKNFLQKMKFLVPLGIGGVAGILLFGKLIGWLFDHYEIQTSFLFIGLMAGTLPSVLHTANRDGFKLWYLLPMLGGIALTLTLGLLEGVSYEGGDAGLGFPVLLLAGAVIGFGTIVPGVSSSFILMSAGLYQPLLNVLNTMDIPRLLPVALGFGVFVLLFAKLVDWLYRKAYGLISYIVFGLLIGSIPPVAVPVWPSLGLNKVTWVSVALACFGAVLTWGLLRLRTGKEGKIESHSLK